MTMEYKSITTTTGFSNEKITQLRESLKDICNSNNSICVVTVGSFARGEASHQSDIDFYLIYDDLKDLDMKDVESTCDNIKEIIEQSGIRMPSPTGAFNEVVKRSEFLENIGGNNDLNESLTRRMLFLLECKWLCNQSSYETLYEKIIHKYVKDTITQHQMCRFLLNDIIRYYRTMCVDFEYKTTEAGKSWGDRNIKLMFSRKLIYFSGILVVAETVQHTWLSKRNILKNSFYNTPIERIENICGNKSNKMLGMYDEFLDAMSRTEIRDMLNATTDDRSTHNEEFRTLKNKGHHFSLELSKLLAVTYDVSHPIHRALIL